MNVVLKSYQLLLRLGILSLFGTTTAAAQNTFVPDDNFEQRLIELGFDSPPLDDFVPTDAIDGIINIELQSENIADLTGIEDFVSLRSLFCYNNQLTTLDVSALSDLESLVVDVNQLTSITLGNKPNLDLLDVSENNLSTIDLSGCPNLVLFLGDENVLTSLNLANNANLTTLAVEENLLTDFNGLDTPLLRFINYSDNPIAELDLSTNSNLVSVRVSFSALTDLDLRNGNNTAITNFDARNNPDLPCISVDDPAFSEANWLNVDATTSFSEDCALSLSDQQFETLQIIPNPTQGWIRLSGIDFCSDLAVSLYSASGQVLLTSNKSSFDVSQFANGMYFVKINDGQRTLSKRLLIAK